MIRWEDKRYVNTGKKIYKEKFELQQITPMIHFQWNEDGATVRATEMKPKLDRFILELKDMLESKENNGDWTEERRCFERLGNIEKLKLRSENERVSLNYKMKIKAYGVNGIVSPKRNEGGIQPNQVDVFEVKNTNSGIGSYFFTDIKEASRGSFYEKIDVDIMCFCEELRNLIRVVFPMFIAVNNFGFRQNKGFGHFRVIKEETEKIEEDKMILKYVKLFSEKYCIYKMDTFQSKKNEKHNYVYILNQIKDLNQRLKSGINLCIRGENKYYAPSFLMKEYEHKQCGEKYINEKKYLKQKMRDTKEIILEKTSKNAPDYKEGSREYENARYFRGILGFAEHYEFRDVKLEGSDRTFKITFKIEYNWNGKKEKESIRYSSPFYFLPVKESHDLFSCIYMFVNKQQIEWIQKKEVTVLFHGEAKLMEKDENSAEDKKIEKKMQKLLDGIPFDKGIPLITNEQFNVEEFLDQYIEEYREKSTCYTFSKITK